MPAKIHPNRSASNSFRCVQTVIPDHPTFVEPGLAEYCLRVECSNGRSPGSQDTYAHAEISGFVRHLDAGQLRSLADALLVAADVLEGKREADEFTRARREREEASRRGEAEKAERERKLAAEGVGIVCVGCGKARRVLPETVADWLRSRPVCCRKRNRGHALAPAECQEAAH